MANPQQPLPPDLGDIYRRGVFHLHDGGTYEVDLDCMDWMLPVACTKWGTAPLCGPNDVDKKVLLDSGCLRSLYTPSTLDVSTIEVAEDMCNVLLMQKCSVIVCRALHNLRSVGTHQFCSGNCGRGEACAWSWLTNAIAFDLEGIQKHDLMGALEALKTLSECVSLGDFSVALLTPNPLRFTHCSLPFWDDVDMWQALQAESMVLDAYDDESSRNSPVSDSFDISCFFSQTSSAA